MNSRNPGLKRWTALGSALSLAWLSVAVALPPAPAISQTVTPAQVTFFETKVRPTLANKCFVCHGATTQLGGLRLDSMAAILKGGGSGPAIVAGDPDKSL